MHQPYLYLDWSSNNIFENVFTNISQHTEINSFVVSQKIERKNIFFPRKNFQQNFLVHYLPLTPRCCIRLCSFIVCLSVYHYSEKKASVEIKRTIFFCCFICIYNIYIDVYFPSFYFHYNVPYSIITLVYSSSSFINNNNI